MRNIQRKRIASSRSAPIRAGLVVVVYTELPDEVIRIVSARKATKKEAELFRKYYGGIDD